MYSLLELLIIDALTIATFLIIKDVMESHYLKAKAQPLTANLGYLM